MLFFACSLESSGLTHLLCLKDSPPTIRVKKPRLHIPVFRNFIFGPKKPFLTGFLRIPFFPAFSGGIFHRNTILEGVAGIPVFFCFYRIFLQEFLQDRNSCIYSRFLRNLDDSSGFLFSPTAVWLRPATKEGSLLSKI